MGDGVQSYWKCNPACPKGSPMRFHWFIHIKFPSSLDQHSNVTIWKCQISISAASELTPRICSIYTESHFLPLSQFAGFKLIFTASAQRDTQTKIMLRFPRACSSSADAQQICFSGIWLTLNNAA